MTVSSSSLVSAPDLARLHSLEVAARLVVEGVRTGAHRSPHKGHSVDFADHRAYVAGDDLRHLDWKVMGRSDRLVIKRYEAETDLACHLCVDGSASMSYHGDRASISKYRYAATLAACLGCLVLEQRDRAGLVLFHEHAAVEQPPALQGQLVRMCRALEAHTPAQGTDAAKGLQRLHAPTTKRGLVILISDLMDEVSTITAAIDRLVHHGHDCALVWVLDPDERDLNVGSVSRFQGLEDDGELTAEPRALRTAYQAEVERHQRELITLCRRRKLAFAACATDEAPHLPLNRLLVALHAERR